jgi:protein SCO1/2
MVGMAVPSAADTPSPIKIGIEERLGHSAALDARFHDESGNIVTMGSLIDRPTVIVPIYFHCKDICPTLLAGVAKVISELSAKENFRVLTVSFDETDSPAEARQTKDNYIQAAGATFPAERWSFLTGSQENVRKLMDSLGFYFQRQDNGTFVHTAALVVVSPHGKIARYLYGTSFLPFDLKMALTEAAEGRVGSMGKQSLMYCFSYAPKGRTYVLNVLRITGIMTLLFAASFFVYLVVTSRKRRQHIDNIGA